MISRRKLKFFSVFLLFTLFVIIIIEILTAHKLLDLTRWHLMQKFNFMRTRNTLIVEKTLQLPEHVIMENIAKEQTNLAVDFWYRNHKHDLKYNDTCALLPNIFKLHYLNAYWQVLETTGNTLHLYAAYLDNRELNPLGPVIRILAMVSLKDKVFPETFCQIWYQDSKEPILTKTFSEEFVWMENWGEPEPGTFQPYLLTCILLEKGGDSSLVPKSVSLTREPCDLATNLLKVNYEVPPKGKRKEDFAVCVRGLSELRDSSVKIIEWIEWLKVIGINKVFMYNYHIHPQIVRVLDYYTHQGFVEVTPLVLSGSDPNSPYLQYYFLQTNAYNYQFDLIAYNDCLLRNLYRYKYVIPLDLNEIPMVQREDNLSMVFRKLDDNVAALALRRATFVEAFQPEPFQDIPEYLKFLQNVHRTRTMGAPGVGIRCFYNTKSMLLYHNHYPLKAIVEPLRTWDFDPMDIYLEQHIEECHEANCEELKLFDSRKWHFREEIVRNVEEVLDKLNYIHYESII